MSADFLSKVFEQNKSKTAIIWKEKNYTYEFLTERISESALLLDDHSINNGSVVALQGDFSPNAIAILLSLIQRGCIIVPITKMTKQKRQKLLGIAEVEFLVEVDEKDNISFNQLSKISHLKYYEVIRNRKHPGLVLFSSGTSGEPKAAVHDFQGLLKKFETKRHPLRTINFLLFDHWGGLNTMLHMLSNGGTLITTEARSPEAICKLIENHKVELLPASPTFLNLLLLSGTHRDYNLDSLKIISYGTEPMPETTLHRLRATFPLVKLLQTYGLIELGVMRSKSENNGSLWVKVGGEGYQTRVVNGILHIKAESAMLGYLNAPSPFSDDGWFITGDEVIEKDGYIKILGRRSEIINVGGEKVYPQEIENVILKMENVAEVTVFAEKNLIIGNIVCANIRLIKSEDNKIFVSKLKKYCGKRMQNYKVPIKVNIIEKDHHNLRFKKTRVS